MTCAATAYKVMTLECTYPVIISNDHFPDFHGQPWATTDLPKVFKETFEVCYSSQMFLAIVCCSQLARSIGQ